MQSRTATPKWRQDFPIEWEGDHYVTRREMVKFLTLGLAAAGGLRTGRRLWPVGSCTADHTSDALSAPPQRWIKPGPCCFVIPQIETRASPCARRKGKLVAYSQVCTHLSCAVVYDKARNGLFCPCHHGLFNLEGQPVAGPPTRPLPQNQFEQRGDKLFAIGWRLMSRTSPGYDTVFRHSDPRRHNRRPSTLAAHRLGGSAAQRGVQDAGSRGRWVHRSAAYQRRIATVRVSLRSRCAGRISATMALTGLVKAKPSSCLRSKIFTAELPPRWSGLRCSPLAGSCGARWHPE